jgi:LysM repeat protein
MSSLVVLPGPGQLPDTPAAGAPTAADAVRPRAAGRRRQPIRLTLRGRLLLAVLVAMAPVVAFTAGRAGAEGPAPAPAAVITVGPGDTLWTIATSVAPTADTRDVVADLVRRNRLASAQVHEGQTLELPPGVSR